MGIQGHFAETVVDGTLYGINSSWRGRGKLAAEVRNTRLAGGRRLLFTFGGNTMTLTGESTIPEEGGLAGEPMPQVTFTLAGGDVDTKTKLYWEQ